MGKHKAGVLARVAYVPESAFGQHCAEGDIVELLEPAGMFLGKQTWWIRLHKTGRRVTFSFRESQLRLLSPLEQLAMVVDAHED